MANLQTSAPLPPPEGNPKRAVNSPAEAMEEVEIARLEAALTRCLNEKRRLQIEFNSFKKNRRWRITAFLRAEEPARQAGRKNEASATERRVAADFDSAAERPPDAKEGSVKTGVERNINPADLRMAELQREIDEEEANIRRLEIAIHSIKTSISWRITAPLLGMYEILHRRPELPTLPWDLVAAQFLRIRLSAERWKNRHLSSPPQSRKRIIFVSGEPRTAGNTYRVEMVAAALAAKGYEARTIPLGRVTRLLPLIEIADAVVIWRAGWIELVRKVVDTARRGGAKLVFDVDDLLLDPSLATPEILDTIRTGYSEQKRMVDYSLKMQTTLRAADFCTASTETLATAMRCFGKPAFVIPNGFDEQTYRTTRGALAQWLENGTDGLIRLGYACGTSTHQRDFARAAPAVARILREHSECRLVLFREGASANALRFIELEEFPEFDGLDEQIEWRLMVPFRQVPKEMVRFNINLAPLETGNVFCEAKSELKYFEAALANIPTVASPTLPFAQAIRHGETGFLARNADEWHACLKQLVTDPELRKRIGDAAFADVISKYGPAQRAELAGAVMERVLSAVGDSTGP